MGNISSAFEGQSFDPSQHEEPMDNSPLPPGEYQVEVEKADVRQTKNEQGLGCNVQFDVIGPDQVGRKLFNWFNLRHSNQRAEQIGQREFAAMCKACGIAAIKDSDELLGKRLTLKVAIDKKDKDANQIKGFKSIEGLSQPNPYPTYPPHKGSEYGQAFKKTDTQPAQQAAPAQQQPAAQSAAPKKMPWME